MKNSLKALSLLVLLGTAGMASAHEIVVASGPRGGLAIEASFPGMRLVFGKPGHYCWYQGHYYSRSEWDRYARFHRYYYGHRRFDRDRYAYDRFYRDQDRDRLDGDRFRNDHDRSPRNDRDRF